MTNGSSARILLCSERHSGFRAEDEAIQTLLSTNTVTTAALLYERAFLEPRAHEVCHFESLRIGNVGTKRLIDELSKRKDAGQFFRDANFFVVDFNRRFHLSLIAEGSEISIMT